MATLQEHIDALDRLVDGRAAVDQIRSQIAFIGREVAALEAEATRLAEENARSIATNANVVAKLKQDYADLLARYETLESGAVPPVPGIRVAGPFGMSD